METRKTWCPGVLSLAKCPFQQSLSPGRRCGRRPLLPFWTEEAFVRCLKLFFNPNWIYIVLSIPQLDQQSPRSPFVESASPPAPLWPLWIIQERREFLKPKRCSPPWLSLPRRGESLKVQRHSRDASTPARRHHSGMPSSRCTSVCGSQPMLQTLRASRHHLPSPPPCQPGHLSGYTPLNPWSSTVWINHFLSQTLKP